MLDRDEIIIAFLLTIMANSVLFLVTLPQTQVVEVEQIYTVESVMKQVNQNEYFVGHRTVASDEFREDLNIDDSKFLSNEDLLNITPQYLKILADSTNSKYLHVWNLLLEECISFSSQGCRTLLSQIISENVYHLKNPETQTYFKRILTHLIILNCYSTNFHKQNRSENDFIECEWGRTIAKNYFIEYELAVQFTNLCNFGFKGACIEKNYYYIQVKDSDLSLLAQNELYHLCQSKYLRACDLWVEHFLPSRVDNLSESLLMHSCVLGSIKSCMILAQKGSKHYSKRAVYYLTHKTKMYE
ncbi:MAG: hypothetical protein KDD58_03405 [Bdellovibrionales bacterium]|nr:hypothetical protein [Bdellovibrionales bacterium]